MRQQISLTLSLLLLGGCAASQPSVVAPRVEPHSVEGAEPQLASYPVIVRIVGRRETITVTAGPDGARVSAVDPTGRMIVRGLTMDELREREPEMYRRLNGQALAADASLGIAE